MVEPPDQPERYCRSCHHSLRGISSRKCPECAREFDPSNPKTMLAHPYHEVWGVLGRLAVFLIRVSVALAALGFIASILGFDRPRMPYTALFLFGSLGLALFIFALAAIPKVRLSIRQRLLGMIF